MRLEVNTAVGGDFSTLEELISFTNTSLNAISLGGRVTIGSGVANQSLLIFESTSTATPATLPNKALAVTSTTEKLFFTRGAENFFLMAFENVATRETPTGDLDGVDVTYTLSPSGGAVIAGTEHVYLNGVLQNEGAGNDYTISSSTITFAVAPISTDKILVSYFQQP